MIVRGMPLLLQVIFRGEIKRIVMFIWFLLYREFYNVVFWWILFYRPKKLSPAASVRVVTRYPIAYKSPDHLIPTGTKQDNSSHKKFVLLMEDIIATSTDRHKNSFLDLGCAGGQLVKDFSDIGWMAVGLEGSDYSLKHKRANWEKLAGKNLFTCDIAKPFQILVNGKKNHFQLITAWEVLEHISVRDLPVLFGNIVKHLDKGGYFIASTTSLPDIHDGVDLHQTKMTNQQWRRWIKKHVPVLHPVDLDIKYYQQVRYNAERSFLTYKRKNESYYQ